LFCLSVNEQATTTTTGTTTTTTTATTTSSLRPMNYDNTSIPTDTDTAGVFNVSMTTVTSPQSSASAGERQNHKPL